MTYAPLWIVGAVAAVALVACADTNTFQHPNHSIPYPPIIDHSPGAQVAARPDVTTMLSAEEQQKGLERSKLLVSRLSDKSSRQERILLLVAAVDACPNADVPHLQLANEYLKSGDLSASERELQAVLAISEKNWRARIGLGEVFMQRGDWVSAKASFSLANSLMQKEQAIDPEVINYVDARLAVINCLGTNAPSTLAGSKPPDVGQQTEPGSDDTTGYKSPKIAAWREARDGLLKGLSSIPPADGQGMQIKAAAILLAWASDVEGTESVDLGAALLSAAASDLLHSACKGSPGALAALGLGDPAYSQSIDNGSLDQLAHAIGDKAPIDPSRARNGAIDPDKWVILQSTRHPAIGTWEGTSTGAGYQSGVAGVFTATITVDGENVTLSGKGRTTRTGGALPSSDSQATTYSGVFRNTVFHHKSSRYGEITIEFDSNWKTARGKQWYGGQLVTTTEWRKVGQ